MNRRIGLSPRVWGSPIRLPCLPSACRSIPTCVGQPQLGPASRPAPGVYPHVCGAATLSATVSSQREGLSPRVWGSRSK